IAGLNMQYRGERLRIRVSVGVANSERDGLTTLSELIALALERARAAMAEGGDRVRTSGRLADPRTWTTELVSIERALALLQAGATDEVRDRLPELLARLLPLLELAERAYGLALPLAELKETIRKAL
ncbi:MAG: diguanylate cyclase response regulator, partial [Rhodocyclaceae bacterium]|nr:diguanylate cyclase response regulator [Rhodocyclaceae bacterium]